MHCHAMTSYCFVVPVVIISLFTSSFCGVFGPYVGVTLSTPTGLYPATFCALVTLMYYFELSSHSNKRKP